MRSQRLLRILDLDRDIKQGREALTYEESAQLSTHENGYWDDLLRRGSRGSRARSLGLGSFLRADIGHQWRLCRRGWFIAVIRDGDSRSERSFRLRDKEVWIGYLNRHNVLTCDDDAGAAFREMPEPNGKVVCQTDAAVGGRIAR